LVKHAETLPTWRSDGQERRFARHSFKFKLDRALRRRVMGSGLEAGDNQLERWRAVLGEAAKEVFLLMVGEELSIPEEANPPIFSEVAGMVGLAGELCGVLTIRCSKVSAGKIACQMLGVAEAEAAAQAIDAVGEICNMVAGNFKAKVAGLEDKCMLSVPTVISGDSYELHSLASGERIELPLLFKGEPVWISLEVQN
jgi:chemotaxis protein CheX